eukprot:CAMPEP_0180661162 /NCGR_PEP_ID=MMETSP1037_2-20121125/58671_1 /TAXON_ID=632150 /ORGANISM="Azadinium spinosum, Strain 3D9" /LENGTH=234 /DNA_ID=CAMNT_0022688659 /DNA_START=8 /DNA_END=715 /DNA_ORIENTATION=+
MIFRTIGHAIQTYAAKECKVLVSGHPSCTNALLCAYHAPRLPKENFIALARLDQNRATGLLAQRAGVSAGDVRNVVIWGSHSQSPDIEHGDIRGRPIRQAFSKAEDRQWLGGKFVQDCAQRGADIVKSRKASPAMSAARAIVDQVHDLHCGTRPGELVSMGVWSSGNEYGITEKLIFSMPATCLGRGRYRIARGLKLTDPTRQRIREADLELCEERRLAQEVLSAQDPAAVPSA